MTSKPIFAEDFLWLNESIAEEKDGELSVYAQGGTDFINILCKDNPREIVCQGNAPVLYKEVQGDFVLTAKVRPTFKTLYDAAGFMLYQSEKLWIKVGYEMTTPTIHRMLSVVSNPYNDDANHAILTSESVWLKMARKKQTIGLYYSVEGENYDMMRVCDLPLLENVIKVGLEAQCSTGNGVTHFFSNIQLERKTVDDIWVGI